MNPPADDSARSKVAIYIRVSTQMQIDKDSLSVQRRELIAYAEMVLGISDYVIFEDAGYSAKNTDRPDYQIMMGRLRSGEFSHLLVWKIDRISRNLLDFTSMYSELKSLGIAFVSKNEQFDTSTAIGEAMLKIILVFAELERKMTAERVSAVMLSRANTGKWNGGRVPFGYKYDKESKTFSFDKVEKEIYDLIVSTYENSKSVTYVTRFLNEKGVPSRTGISWRPATVHGILTNPWYTGVYRYNVRDESSGWRRKEKEDWILIEDHHEPAIDRERFDRILAMLARNKRGGNAMGQTRIRKNIHIFGGLIKCGLCGSTMTATIDRRRVNGWRPSVYGCPERRDKKRSCSNKFTSDATVGPFVFNFISNIVRARGKVTEKMTTGSLEKLLLHGSVFSGVSKIDGESLLQLKQAILANNLGLQYRPPEDSDAVPAVQAELKTLREQKRNMRQRLENSSLSTYFLRMGFQKRTILSRSRTFLCRSSQSKKG